MRAHLLESAVEARRLLALGSHFMHGGCSLRLQLARVLRRRMLHCRCKMVHYVAASVALRASARVLRRQHRTAYVHACVDVCACVHVSACTVCVRACVHVCAYMCVRACGCVGA